MNRPRCTPPFSRLLSFALSALLSLVTLSVPRAHAAPGNVVISQIYGGGGTTYTHDYVELHNRTAVAVNITGWTVQYATATESVWSGTPLTGTIPAGGYYLVREAFGAGGGLPLPSPNALGLIDLSPTSGKVALVSNNTILAGNCPSSPSIVDLVGYGSADCSETSPMVALRPMVPVTLAVGSGFPVAPPEACATSR